ncbi:hypothetical protein N0V82_004069 [Gnomoniopsis sp. IMI 355080]|nr:hypothetical protein N0V82_004069 [Gnomoniopsis sp. IMI 355080]
MADSEAITPATSTGRKKEECELVSPLKHTPSTQTGPASVQQQPNRITTRQFVGMAVGSSIGAGLFVASGIALQKGGPGSLVLAFLLLGPFVWHTMCALAELSATFPAGGSFYDYAFRFISRSWGFAMGWDYVLNWHLMMPFEITVIMILLEYWHPEEPARYLLIAAVGLLGALGLIQYCGSKIYGEVEFICGFVKLAVLSAFTITAFVKTGEAGNMGFENYLHGAAFLNGFRGFLGVFVSTGLAYGGVEALGLVTRECEHPRRVLALSTWIVALRICFLYVVAPFCIGLILKPSQLLSDEFKGPQLVSPFVAAVKVNNIPYMDHVINGILVVCVFSMANAATFAASRSLAAICGKGLGPGLFSKLTGRREIPLSALAVVFLFSLLVFFTAVPKGSLIFDWLISLASVANYFTWITINWAHIRVRQAIRHQGRNINELQWRAPMSEWGSYVSIVAFVTVMICQIVSYILPPVLESEAGDSRVGLAFQGLLGFIIFSLLFFGHLMYVALQGGTSWRERLLIPLRDISLPELDAARSSDEIVEKNESSSLA